MTMPEFAGPTYDEHDQLDLPATPADAITMMDYALRKLAKVAITHPERLQEIRDDLDEAFDILIPAAEHVELAATAAAVA